LAGAGILAARFGIQPGIQHRLAAGGQDFILRGDALMFDVDAAGDIVI
jgi:hypothetical protein